MKLILFIFCFITIIYSEKYYVSNSIGNSNNNCGLTREYPCNSVKLISSKIEDSDIIVLLPGVYNTSINFPIYIHKENITLMAEEGDKGDVILQIDDFNFNMITYVLITVDVNTKFTMKNLNINSNANLGFTTSKNSTNIRIYKFVYLKNGNIVVENCVFENFDSPYQNDVMKPENGDDSNDYNVFGFGNDRFVQKRDETSDIYVFHLFNLQNVKNGDSTILTKLTIKDTTFNNITDWTLIYSFCSDLDIDNVVINEFNHKFSHIAIDDKFIVSNVFIYPISLFCIDHEYRVYSSFNDVTISNSVFDNFLYIRDTPVSSLIDHDFNFDSMKIKNNKISNCFFRISFPTLSYTLSNSIIENNNIDDLDNSHHLFDSVLIKADLKFGQDMYPSTIKIKNNQYINNNLQFFNQSTTVNSVFTSIISSNTFSSNYFDNNKINDKNPSPKNESRIPNIDIKYFFTFIPSGPKFDVNITDNQMIENTGFGFLNSFFYNEYSFPDRYNILIDSLNVEKNMLISNPDKELKDKKTSRVYILNLELQDSVMITISNSFFNNNKNVSHIIHFKEIGEIYIYSSIIIQKTEFNYNDFNEPDINDVIYCNSEDTSLWIYGDTEFLGNSIETPIHGICRLNCQDQDLCDGLKKGYSDDVSDTDAHLDSLFWLYLIVPLVLVIVVIVVGCILFFLKKKVSSGSLYSLVSQTDSDQTNNQLELDEI